MKDVPRFKPVAWVVNSESQKLSLTHLMHEGRILCTVKLPTDPTVQIVTRGRVDCFNCVKRGRSLQGRNVETGKPYDAP